MKKLDLKNSKDYNKIEEVATVIKEGGLVLFPTETIYGIRANGLDEKAVKKIFDAKGRASDNPLILHIANINMLMDYIIDGGKCEVGLESTVVKVENGEIKILRPGKISLVYSENSDKMINKINELVVISQTYQLCVQLRIKKVMRINMF